MGSVFWGGHPVSKRSQPQSRQPYLLVSKCGICFAVKLWGAEDVGSWLESNHLHEYRERFVQNDVTGKELLKLDVADLKVGLVTL